MVERRVAAMRVVPTLDEIEHRYAGHDLGFETLAVEQLAFESGEEALGPGVIEASARCDLFARRTFSSKSRAMLGGPNKKTRERELPGLLFFDAS